MKNKIIVLLLAVVMLGVIINVYAADGDLIVNGKLGVGTANPDSKVNVEGGQLVVTNAETGSGALRLGAAWGHPAVWQMNSVGSKDLLIGNQNANNIRFYSNATYESMRITSDGNVGIGTTTPVSKLDVNGDLNVVGKISGALGSVVSDCKYVNGYTATYPQNNYINEFNITLTLPKKSVIIQQFTGNYNIATGSWGYVDLQQNNAGLCGSHIPATSNKWNYISLHFVNTLNAGTHTFKVHLGGADGTWSFYQGVHSVVAIPVN